MKQHPTITAIAFVLSLVTSGVFAGTSGRAPITVKDVDFDQNSAGWITADVKFQAGDFAASKNARKKDYLNKVKLTLTASYEDRDLANSKSASPDQKKAPFEFYQRSVELTAVKRSKIITIRFFIPPAVVESKSFSAKPVAWMLGWEVEGLAMPVDVKLFPDNFSSNLRKTGALADFQKRLEVGAKENEGIMLAQYHGPSSLQPKSSKDFAFVRKDQ